MPFPRLLRRLALASLLAAVVVTPAVAFKRTFKAEALKDFEISDVAGESVRLLASLGEKATVLIFWASWSPRSSEALGEFQEIYAEHRGTGLQVVAVNVEHQELEAEQRRSIATFAATQGLTYPVLVDDGLRVFNAYGVIAVPSLILADADGNILDLLEGYSNMTRCDFRDRVLEALGMLQPVVEGSPEVSAYCPVGKAARYFQMGELFLNKKMVGRAVKALRRAVKEDPKYAEAYVHLAAALDLQGEGVAAAEAREQAAALGMPPRLAAVAALEGHGAEAPDPVLDVDSAGGGAGQGAAGIAPQAAGFSRSRAAAEEATAEERRDASPMGKAK
ncbi:MAG: redoxin domain-containing protein [Deferrisomatales bacterium]|nr:redoxin domain-containing protein [Deferrisomatales bacterium]